MTDLTNAVTALQNGDSVAFREAVRASLIDKVKGALELERVSVGQSLFNAEEEAGDPEANEEV